MKLINTELLANPSNWIKVGLMMATFFLGAQFVANIVFTPAIVQPSN